jgi:hypothetical protein
MTPADPFMSKIDRDQGGSVSLNEAKRAAMVKFNTLDTDKRAHLMPADLVGVLPVTIWRRRIKTIARTSGILALV